MQKKKRWRSIDLVWSVCKKHKKLDQAGRATSADFRVVSHAQLM